MAKALYICYRNSEQYRENRGANRKSSKVEGVRQSDRPAAGDESTNVYSSGQLTHRDLIDICRCLEPDNFTPKAPLVISGEPIAVAVMNPGGRVELENCSLKLGAVFDGYSNWSRPGTGHPDGSYAIFRADDEQVEVLSDEAGSRTIWYFMDENRFIASTSQRAIVMALGSFEFNEKIVPWILSGGSPGPDQSWDRRIKRLPAASTITLNRASWSIGIETRPVRFKPAKRSDSEHIASLRKAISDTISSLNLDVEKWYLPLSGGYDSRGLLFFFREQGRDDIQTLTYGLEASLHEPGNDVSVARELARNVNVKNRFYPTDISNEALPVVVERFLRLGEGCTDQITAYMDGFDMWKQMAEDGIEGIVRGDEGFGQLHGATQTGWSRKQFKLKVRESVNAYYCSDFRELSSFTHQLPVQQLPVELERQRKETLYDWRDRLYQQYRLPIGLAALNDLKCAYLEQITPFLSKQILETVRSLPPEYRTNKRAYRKIIDSFTPRLPIAEKGGGPFPGDLFAWPEFVKLLRENLKPENRPDRQSDKLQRVVPRTLIDSALTGLRVVQGDGVSSQGQPSDIRKPMPDQKNMNDPKTESNGSHPKNSQHRQDSASWILSLKKFMFRLLRTVSGNRFAKKRLDPNRLAFRIYMIQFMYMQLEEDAKEVVNADQ